MSAQIIDLERCEHGAVYVVDARNFSLAAFDAETSGFVGIREKLGSRFLFTEYHRDVGGTALALTRVGIVPDGVEVKERNPGTFCDYCRREVAYYGERRGAPGDATTDPSVWPWVHVGASCGQRVSPVSGGIYQPLMRALERIEVTTAPGYPPSHRADPAPPRG